MVLHKQNINKTNLVTVKAAFVQIQVVETIKELCVCTCIYACAYIIHIYIVVIHKQYCNVNIISEEGVGLSRVKY